MSLTATFTVTSAAAAAETMMQKVEKTNLSLSQSSPLGELATAKSQADSPMPNLK